MKHKLPLPTKTLGNAKGQSIIEIALITPLLLAALYVAFDFGIAFFTGHYAQNAVREAARVGSVLPDCTLVSTGPCVSTVTESCPGSAKVVTEACTRLPNLLTGRTVAVTLTGKITEKNNEYTFPTCRREVKVAATGTYSYGLYNVMALIGMPLTTKTLEITRSADARYELQPVTYTNPCLS